MKIKCLIISLLFASVFLNPGCSFAQVVNVNNGVNLVAEGNINLVIDDGGIKNDGVFTPGNSTVFFDGASTTAINGSQPTNFYNITFRGSGTKLNNADAAVINTISVEGTTVFDADGSANDRAFTLKSSDTATANVDKIVNADIIGNVTVERFINTGTENGQHAKSWQFLATPTTGQTYFQSWQEGSLTPAAFGTWITGTGTGFDATTALPSLKYYNQATGSWVGITNTGDPLQNKLGYMLFVRGDRTVTAFNAPPNNTNMRSKGVLFTPVNPPASVPVMANQFQSFGNPYASRIEFDKVYQASTGINNVFYVWDPKLNGNYGAGGYQTLSAVTGYIPAAGSSTTYYPAGVPSPFIESGQAVLIQGNGAGGNVNFDENCKVAGNRLINRQAVSNNSNLPVNRQFLFATLFTGSGMIADGNIAAFENGFGNEINEFDAKKIMNAGENFGIARSDKLFAVEARNEIVADDTIFYHIQNLKQQTYQLRFAPVNIPAVLTAFLIDRFNNNSTAISLTDSSFVNIIINAEPGSAANDRFLLVFRQASVVPVKTINLAAIRNSDQVNFLTWKVENELNLQEYEIERSSDGRNFSKLGNNAPTVNNGGPAVYRYIDRTPLATVNFYRIKAISTDDQIQYSNIVKLASENIAAGIAVYPNPVTDQTIHIIFKHQKNGKYRVELSNKLGQIIYSSSVSISQDYVTQAIKPGIIMAAGTYQLRVTGEDGAKTIEQVMVR